MTAATPGSIKIPRSDQTPPGDDLLSSTQPKTVYDSPILETSRSSQTTATSPPPVVRLASATPDDEVPQSSIQMSTTRIRSRQQNRNKPNRQKCTSLILQWNINGLFNNLGDLEILVKDFNHIVIAIQEINRINMTGIKSILGGKYRWYINRGRTLQHSIATRIQINTPHSKIPLKTGLPIAAIRCHLPIPITIVNAYLCCGRTANLKTKITDVPQAADIPVIFLGDLNAHHSNWGLQKADTKGNPLADLFEENELSILHGGYLLKRKTAISDRRFRCQYQST